MLTVPQYEAAAWLRIEEKTPYLAFELRNDDRSRAFFQTQVELIRSPLVLGLAVKRPEIADLPELADRADKIGWLSKRIQVNPVGESELFKIVFCSPNPNRAAAIANAVTDAYFRLRGQSEAERNQYVLELLQQEKASRASEVLRLRGDLQELAKQVMGSNPLAAKADAGANDNNPLADLRNRLIMVQVERAVLEAKVKAAERTIAAPKENSAAGYAGAGAGPARQELAPYEMALRDAMVASRIEESPEVKQQTARILAQQSKLREIEATAIQGVKDPDYIRVQAEIARAQKALEGLRREVRPRVEKETEATLIARRTEAQSAMAAKRSDELVGMRAEIRGQEILQRRIEEEYQKTLKEVKQASGSTLLLEFKRDELSQAEKVLELMSQRRIAASDGTRRSGPRFAADVGAAAERPDVQRPAEHAVGRFGRLVHAFARGDRLGTDHASRR